MQHCTDEATMNSVFRRAKSRQQLLLMKLSLQDDNCMHAHDTASDAFRKVVLLAKQDGLCRRRRVYVAEPMLQDVVHYSVSGFVCKSQQRSLKHGMEQPYPSQGPFEFMQIHAIARTLRIKWNPVFQ